MDANCNELIFRWIGVVGEMMKISLKVLSLQAERARYFAICKRLMYLLFKFQLTNLHGAYS